MVRPMRRPGTTEHTCCHVHIAIADDGAAYGGRAHGLSGGFVEQHRGRGHLQARCGGKTSEHVRRRSIVPEGVVVATHNGTDAVVFAEHIYEVGGAHGAHLCIKTEDVNLRPYRQQRVQQRLLGDNVCQQRRTFVRRYLPLRRHGDIIRPKAEHDHDGRRQTSLWWLYVVCPWLLSSALA